MSLLTQQAVFYTTRRSLILEADPNTIDSLECVCRTLGACQDEKDAHRFKFQFNSEETSEKALSAIEMIWEKFRLTPFFRIRICCGDKTFTVEGNTDAFQAFSALVYSFNKDVQDETIVFSESEWNRFEAIHAAALAMGIIPYC